MTTATRPLRLDEYDLTTRPGPLPGAVLLYMEVEVSIRGKARARRAPAGHFYTPKATVSAERIIAWEAKRRGWPRVLAKGMYFGLRVAFEAPGRVDVDNGYKLVADALAGVVYGNDCRVVEGYARRFKPADPARPRARILVYESGP